MQKSRHSQSYDVSGLKVFFLWEASRCDSGGQASPGAGGVGRWNDVPPWVDGCCALDFDTNLFPKPIETLSGVCVWKSQTPVNCWLFEHIDHYRLWHMLVVCDSMSQYVTVCDRFEVSLAEHFDFPKSSLTNSKDQWRSFFQNLCWQCPLSHNSVTGCLFVHIWFIFGVVDFLLSVQHV